MLAIIISIIMVFIEEPVAALLFRWPCPYKPLEAGLFPLFHHPNCPSVALHCLSYINDWTLLEFAGETGLSINQALKFSYIIRAIAKEKAPNTHPLDPAKPIEASAELVFAPVLSVAITAGTDPSFVLPAAVAAAPAVPV